MQALIVVERLRAQVPETQQRAQENNSPEWQPGQKLLARRPPEAPGTARTVLVGRLQQSV